MDNEDLVVKAKRPKGEEGYKVFSIRIREETVKKIDAISAQTGRSRTALIGQFLEFAVDRCTVAG